MGIIGKISMIWRPTDASANAEGAVELGSVRVDPPPSMGDDESSSGALLLRPQAAAALGCSDGGGGGGGDATKVGTTLQPLSHFMGWHFFWFMVVGWILDFGRPVFTHRSFQLFHLDTHKGPRLGDYMHFIHNLFNIQLLSTMMASTSIPASPHVIRITMALMTHVSQHNPHTTFTPNPQIANNHHKTVHFPHHSRFASLHFTSQGMAIHLIGDSVQSRLVDMGVDTSMHVSETPLIKACANAVYDVPNVRCQPGGAFQDIDPEWCSGPGLVTKMNEMFENLYIYDEYIGHYIWIAGELFCLLLFFWGCFVKDRAMVGKRPHLLWYVALAPLPLMYFPYFYIEAQAWPIFILFCFVMAVRYLYMKRLGWHLDVNGTFLLQWWGLSLLVFIIWVAVLGVPFICVLKLRVTAVPEYWESSVTKKLFFFVPFWHKDGHFFKHLDRADNWGCSTTS